MFRSRLELRPLDPESSALVFWPTRFTNIVRLFYKSFTIKGLLHCKFRKWGVTRAIVFATCNATFVALQVAGKVELSYTFEALRDKLLRVTCPAQLAMFSFVIVALQVAGKIASCNMALICICNLVDCNCLKSMGYHVHHTLSCLSALVVSGTDD